MLGKFHPNQHWTILADITFHSACGENEHCHQGPANGDIFPAIELSCFDPKNMSINMQ